MRVQARASVRSPLNLENRMGIHLPHINLPPAVEIIGRLGKLTDLADEWKVDSADGVVTGEEFVRLMDGVAQVLTGKSLDELQIKLDFLHQPDASTP